MTRFRRHAIVNLSISLAAAAAVVGVFLATGRVQPAMAGFAVLGLLGAGPLWARRRGTPIVQDEREAAIGRKAALLAYTIFWLAFVTWGVVVSLRYADAQAVPLAAVEPVVWTGAWLVIMVRAASGLIFDLRGS
jgi:uncharacterized membrane protein